MDRYAWEGVGRFRSREPDLGALDQWWESPTRDALALVGRRRVGKSWLFRRFAHGKPALILIAEQEVAAAQLQRFAERLAPALGVKPSIADLPDLFRLLYRLGHDERYLAVIDEFPYLLPSGRAGQTMLARIQAVMEEERDRSLTKLILCGSHIGQMESLLALESPLHGRLRQMDVLPFAFEEALPFLSGAEGAEAKIERFAIAGGMARYLTELGEPESLEEAIVDRVLNHRGSLFHDPAGVLGQELREPAVPFSILNALARNPAGIAYITDRLRMQTRQITPYLDTLQRLQIIEASAPVGAGPRSRKHRYHVKDGFIRFWFRFVFPRRETLQTGTSPAEVWRSDVEPQISDFVAPAFERICATYLRRSSAEPLWEASAWWGKSLNAYRMEGIRTTEEIDLVGTYEGKIRYVGECKWTHRPMPLETLDTLLRYKLPALAEHSALSIPKGGPRIFLFSRSGFDRRILEEASANPRLRLVNPEDLLGDSA